MRTLLFLLCGFLLAGACRLLIKLFSAVYPPAAVTFALFFHCCGSAWPSRICSLALPGPATALLRSSLFFCSYSSLRCCLYCGSPGNSITPDTGQTRDVRHPGHESAGTGAYRRRSIHVDLPHLRQALACRLARKPGVHRRQILAGIALCGRLVPAIGDFAEDRQLRAFGRIECQIGIF